MRHVGAHLDVDRNEAAIAHRDAGLLGADLLAVRAAAHGLQHEVVDLRLLRRVLALEGDLDAFLRGFGADRLGLEHDVVEARRVHLLPDLHEVAVGALHQAVHHLDHIQARAQSAVHRAHFEADDATAQNEHALGHFLERQGAGGVDHAWIVWHEGQAHGLTSGGDDGLLEGDDLLGARLLLRSAGGFFHF
ncbi:hypothetical protein D3C72_1832730 [compost metagenome]